VANHGWATPAPWVEHFDSHVRVWADGVTTKSSPTTNPPRSSLRRFKDKQALLDALAQRLLADAVEVAERHLDDPGGTGLEEIGELLATNRGLVARMWNVPASHR
jgi:hypothetical protein